MTTVGIGTALVLSFVLGYIFTPFVRGIAVRWRICEKPNGRTSRDIAHIGGVAIIGSILLTLIPLFLFSLPESRLHRAFLPVLIASGFLTFLLGIIDDLRSLHYLYKLFFQILVSLFVSAGGIALLEHFGIVHMSLLASFVAFGASAVWMLTVTTSFNLIDGIDGLAAGTALIAAVSFAAAGFMTGHPLVVAVSLVIIGAVLAFLRYNFPPARIFMGDSGSLFLGLLLGLVSLLLLLSNGKLFFTAAGCVIVLAVPLLDTVLAFLRRLMTDRHVFQADLRHIHHMLLYRFKSVIKVDLILWGLSTAFGILGVLTMRGSIVALVAASTIMVGVFLPALRSMIRFDISGSRAKEILVHCGINPSRMASFKD